MQVPTTDDFLATADTNAFGRWVLKKLNTELQLVTLRLTGLRERFASAGPGFDAQVYQLDAVALRLHTLKARVVPMGAMARYGNRKVEEREVVAIGEQIDRVVQG